MLSYHCGRVGTFRYLDFINFYLNANGKVLWVPIKAKVNEIIH